MAAYRDSATLAQRLIASLDALDDAENERLWIEEAERRYQEYKKGNIQARAADDVLRDARSAIPLTARSPRGTGILPVDFLIF